MTLFVIMTPPGNPHVELFEAAMRREFGDSFKRVADGQYLAAKPNATSTDIQRAIGPTGEVGQFIVVTNGGWGGWHQIEHWEWMRVHGA